MSSEAPVPVTPPVKPPVKRPKHLMDPDNLQRPVNDHRLTNVQRWVWTITLVFIVTHLAIGLAVASIALDDDATGGIIGLNVIAAVMGVLSLVAGFALHDKNPLHWPYWPWLLLGLLPGVIGAYVALA